MTGSSTRSLIEAVIAFVGRDGFHLVRGTPFARGAGSSPRQLDEAGSDFVGTSRSKRVRPWAARETCKPCCSRSKTWLASAAAARRARAGPAPPRARARLRRLRARCTWATWGVAATPAVRLSMLGTFHKFDWILFSN
jgi:hypothetical protein